MLTLPTLLLAFSLLITYCLLYLVDAGIAETLLALADGGWSALVPTALLLDVAAVVPRMDKQRLYRGKGGDLLRQASCQLLEHLARSGMAGIPVKER